MMKVKKKFRQATSNDVCRIYELLHKEGLVAFPLTKEGREKIDAIVANINGTYFGKEAYGASREKAVAYLYFIIKDHPFTDGNKRTASLVFEVVCNINKLRPNYSEFGLDEIAVFVEAVQEQDHRQVIRRVAGLMFGPEGL